MKRFYTLFDTLLDTVNLLLQTIKTFWSQVVTYLLVVLALWGPLMLIEGLLYYTVAGDALALMSPFFFIQAALSGDAVREIIRTFPLDAAVRYLLLVTGIVIVEAFLVQNLIQCALIQTTHGATRGLAGYRLPLWCYLSVLLVAVLSGVLIVLPTFLILALLFGALLISWPPELAGLLEVIAPIGLVGAVFLLIPMTLIVLFRFMLAPQAVVVDRLGPLRAMGRSWRLVRGFRRYLMLFLVVCVLAVLPFIFGLALPDVQRHTLFAASDGNTTTLSLWLVLSHVLSTMITGLLLPFQAIAMTLLYQQVRQEALAVS